MSISWIKCLSIRNKNNVDLVSIKSDEIKKILKDSILQNTIKDPLIDDYSHSDSRHYTRSKSNTISGMNLSNVFEPNPAMVRASSFVWPDVEMNYLGCKGHECLQKSDDINKVILYQRTERYKNDRFTPPIFPKTGIAVCPEPLPIGDSFAEPGEMSKRMSSVLENDIYYKTPGNMEFIDFTYPSITHKWRYTTYGVPNNRNDWEWIYNYIRTIKNAFRRKYLCDVFLSSEPGNYKGRVAYLVRLEADDQAHILQCRSGLPKCLRQIIVEPTNAICDIECFVTEYLIKRKTVFRSTRNPNKYSNSESYKPLLQLKSDVSESSADDYTKTISESKLADNTTKLNHPPAFVKIFSKP